MKEQKIIIGLCLALLITIGFFVRYATKKEAGIEKPLKATEINIEVKEIDGKPVVIPLADALSSIQVAALQIVKLPDGREVTLQSAIYEDLQKIKAAVNIQ